MGREQQAIDVRCDPDSTRQAGVGVAGNLHRHSCAVRVAGALVANLIADGSHGSTYVQALQGDGKTWDQWPTIRKANPLTMISAKFRAKFLEERDAARADSRLDGKQPAMSL